MIKLQRLVTSFFLFYSPIYKYQISGQSMQPTLEEGSTVLVNRLAYLFKDPQIGEIVAIKNPTGREVLIKRISRVENAAKQSKKYFVLGDNKNYSTDSRKFGMIEKKKIIGKVLAFSL